MTELLRDYPWTTAPLITNGPMRLIAMADLAVEVSASGGLGFIGPGTDLDILDQELEKAAKLISNYPTLQAYRDRTGVLPVGFGTLNWGADLGLATAAVAKWKPAAVWFFGAYNNRDYVEWTEKLREAGEGKTKIWIQICTVADALEIAKDCKPEVLVVQGTDAGGHGQVNAAGIISLLPEVDDAIHDKGFSDIALVAAGGIVDGRGVAAALTLGANGVTMGTRFLACEEANIADGYRQEVVRASDGGLTTARSTVYDRLRGITLWPAHYNGRGIINQSFHDHSTGLSIEENKKLHDEAMKQGDKGWGVEGRLTTYAGTGVGLIHNVMKAGDIVREVQKTAKNRVASLQK